MIKTAVKFYHKGDSDKNGTILIICKSRKDATQYLKEWVNCHSTQMYPYTKMVDGSYRSKFTRVYIESLTP